ncbi:hypothetical protein J2X56_002584 [Herbaspirillum sp. 1173]|uniref:hypothetical protein n=1 Tax=Herbaspirillum sp. 1173 TaxID=2817734 RepID=UPI002864D0F5|nr:hypothetical protein [Herbaspirillum sp. 1173]MDR6740566.1 hypothetical protein [Herbaspirillum sp. 1173]
MNDMKSLFYSALSFTLLTLFSLSAQAETKDFGDWSVSISPSGFPYAATTNSAGDLLIKTCNISSGTCSWLQASKIACEEGSTAVALINSPTGAAVNKMVCEGAYASDRQTLYNYSLEKPDEFDGIVAKSSGLVGIAHPLASGQFEVSRFSLNGARQAVEFLMSLAVEMTKRRKSSLSRERL